MSATATVSEAEVPSVLWGLNPIFSAFARLYIKDILEMTESKQVPGIFFYNRHPIKQVDILGTLVLIKERNAFHTYGDFESSSCGLDLIEQIRKLQMAVHKKTNLQIGDLVRVRGSIRVYRQQREIKASLYYKVDDPAYEVQIARLLELPRLYRDIYDKPFQIPEETKSSQGVASLFGSVSVLSEKIRAFLLRNKIQSFYKQDLETVEEFVDLIRQGTAAEQTDSKPHSFSSLIRESFLEAIRILENKGVLFQKSKNPNDMYYVTEQDRELHRVTLKVLKEDCKRPKYAEKGCHLRHIHNCVNQNYSPYVTEIVVRCLLDWLETNSDIVTTMEGYYTVF
ncbi:CST complex subunit STN1 isoform X3 [Anolis carolinensis]|uniref:CST complex subunit STN1 isoform X3 n=1 Tax=Anolis carolinensis TaxID=28377 RepID=UPI0007DB77CC|nr:PREDICTED: CST complex subunit STN1 isoform X3 [Anolis carolinensis]|eukprot:XP_016847661.1 PREDICTED: CST complex subunit STN1 isoform X3 [Anolis carolinensis]